MATNAPLSEMLLRSLDAASVLVRSVGPDDLDRATPCTGWDLGRLLGHLVGQHLGFARALTTGDSEPADFRAVALTPDSMPTAWRSSVAQLRDAVGATDDGTGIRLAEIDAERRFEPQTVIGMQLLDTAVHTWDIARSLGVDFRPEPDVVRQVARIAAGVPAGTSRDTTEAFAQPTSSSGSDEWARALAYLGRKPDARGPERQIVSSGAQWEPVVGYSRAVRVGSWVSVAGTTAAGSDGPVGGSDPAAQTREIVRRIAAALEQVGGSLHDVVRTRMFVTDISRWEEIGRAHGEAFAEIRPASSMIEVKGLIAPELMVEIEADAVIAGPGSKP